MDKVYNTTTKRNNQTGFGIYRKSQNFENIEIILMSPCDIDQCSSRRRCPT